MVAADDSQQVRPNTLGCGTVILGMLLILHFFANRIWVKEPWPLRWFVIGYGFLILVNLTITVFIGTPDDRKWALGLLVFIVFIIAVGSLF